MLKYMLFAIVGVLNLSLHAQDWVKITFDDPKFEPVKIRVRFSGSHSILWGQRNNLSGYGEDVYIRCRLRNSKLEKGNVFFQVMPSKRLEVKEEFRNRKIDILELGRDPEILKFDNTPFKGIVRERIRIFFFDKSGERIGAFNKEIILVYTEESHNANTSPDSYQEEKIWEESIEDGSKSALENYLNTYPNGKYAKEARERIEEIRIENDPSLRLEEKAWLAAKEKNTKYGYLEFINSFPSSKYKNEALRTLKNLELELWKKTEGIGTVEAYKHYIKEFPDGDYVEFATKRIQEIETDFDLDTFLEENLLAEISARLIEVIPDTMYVGIQERISIEITTDTSSTRLQFEMEKKVTGGAQAHNISSSIIAGVGKEMKARLLDTSLEGNKNFTITSIFPNSLRVIDFHNGKNALWAWNLTPHVKGEHQISLTLERVISEGKGDNHKILDKKILVLVKETWLQQYGIWTAVLLFLVIVFGLYRRSQKKHEEEIYPLESLDSLIDLISKNETGKALQLIHDQRLSKKHKNQIILLRSRLEGVLDKSRKGISDEASMGIERNKINTQLLDIINEIKETVSARFQK